MGAYDTLAPTPVSDHDILGIYRAVLSEASVERHDRTNGWFGRYCGRIAEPGSDERYLRAIRNMLQLQQRPVAGLRVLEVGSGFGLTCLTLALLGAKSVDCIDTSEPMIETMRGYLSDLPYALPIRPRVGLAYELPYRDGEFDLVITVEALSHFLHPQRCLAEAYRVLKPGGRYVIADDNNALNERAAQETREVWDRFENGPATGNIHGHRVREPYVERRRRLIGEAFPQLLSHDVEALARRTCYKVKAEVLEDVRRFLADGALPDSNYSPQRCPVEPETGQFIENLIDPLALARELEALGFSVEPEAYFGGESRGGLVYAANRLLNGLLPRALLFSRSDGFRVRAEK